MLPYGRVEAFMSGFTAGEFMHSYKQRTCQKMHKYQINSMIWHNLCEIPVMPQQRLKDVLKKLEKPLHSDWRIPYYIPDLPVCDEILPYLQMIDQNHWYSNFGPLEQSLRTQFAKHFFKDSRTEHLTFTNTGTMALSLALKALPLKPGSKVLVPALTFPATALAVLNAGFTPVVLKNHSTLELTVEQALSALELVDIDAIVPVFYHCIDKRPDWDDFTASSGIPVVADACPALGIQDLPRHMIMTFSLHATKYFGCGEGGLVLSADMDFIQRVRKLSNFSLSQGFVDQPGDNGKLSEYHAAVAHVQVKRMQLIRRRKSQITAYYQQNFSRLNEDFKVVSELDNWPSNILIQSEHYSMMDLMRYLDRKSIQARLFHYPDLSEQPFLQDYQCISLPGINTHTPGNILSLPFHNALSKQQVDEISNSLNDYIEESDSYHHNLFKSTVNG